MTLLSMHLAAFMRFPLLAADIAALCRVRALRGASVSLQPRTMASAAGIPTWENVYINGQRRWHRLVGNLSI